MSIATLLFAVACDTEPADVAGDYSIALTNRANGCSFTDWEVGNTASNIPLTITQEEANVSGTVGGASGGLLNLWLGSNVYQGTVTGDSVTMTIYGERSSTEGNCTYTINSTIDADLNGDILSGDIEYTAATNGNPDCGAIEGCVSLQEFNGTRPPS